MSILRSTTAWLRLTFRWSNSTQTWHERLGDLGLLGGIGLAVALTLLVSVEGWQLGLIWGCCLLPALVFGALGWLKIFGPVLYYDMIRQSRRSRFIILRFLYALLLVFLLFSVALSVTDLRLSQTDPRRAADIAQTYFDWFMVAQFITVVLLTPAYVGGAISDEKDRKTLEFMLATDLLNREIVLSKLGSRLANLGLVVLTGLPILSVMQFLGGVDPNLVLAGFAMTVMTIFGQAGVSILCSTVCKKPRESIALSYLAVVVYYAVAAVLALGVFSTGIASESLWESDSAPTFGDLLGFYNKGNLVTAIAEVKMAAGIGTLATTLPKVVASYAIFHGLIALACIALAVARLRRVALAQSYGKPIKARGGARLWQRPEVGSLPMLWKELNCEGGHRSPWIAFVIFALLLAATFVPAILIVWENYRNFYREFSSYSNLAASMNAWVRICNVVVGYLTLMAIGVRASTSITTEREKQTFDTLLTTPLDSASILGAKWWGSFIGVRFGVLWLVLIWAVGIVTGGLHPVGLLFVIVAFAIYAAFAATLGLWFSVTSKSSLRATVWTIALMILTGVGHWLIWACCGPLLVFSRGRSMENIGEYVAKAQLGVLTPGFVMGWSPFSIMEFERADGFRDNTWWEFTVFALAGLVAYSFAAGILYSLTSARFRKLTHRERYILADGRGEDDRQARERRQKPAAPISPWAPPTGDLTADDSEEESEDFRYRP